MPFSMDRISCRLPGRLFGVGMWCDVMWCDTWTRPVILRLTVWSSLQQEGHVRNMLIKLQNHTLLHHTLLSLFAQTHLHFPWSLIIFFLPIVLSYPSLSSILFVVKVTWRGHTHRWRTKFSGPFIFARKILYSCKYNCPQASLVDLALLNYINQEIIIRQLKTEILLTPLDVRYPFASWAMPWCKTHIIYIHYYHYLNYLADHLKYLSLTLIKEHATNVAKYYHNT